MGLRRVRFSNTLTIEHNKNKLGECALTSRFSLREHIMITTDTALSSPGPGFAPAWPGLAIVTI